MALPILPPLNALRAFKVASLTGSFSAAADELCVSQGAVSRHIAKLEDYLGIKLFDRVNREVRLTPSGHQYAAELQIAFELIEQATRDLHVEKKRARLKIGVFPSLANTWVMELIQNYQELNPDLGLDIVCQTMFSDVDIHALDIMSMNTDLRQHNIEYLPLLNVVLTPICSRSIAGELREDPRRIQHHTMLHSLRRPDHWATWLKAAGLPPQHGRSIRHFENSALAQQAAMCGMGIAMSLTGLENHLPSYREMVQPFELKVALEESYGFAWRPGQGSSKTVRAFIDWLREQKQARAASLVDRSSTDTPLRLMSRPPATAAA